MLLSYKQPYKLPYGVYIVPCPSPDNHYKIYRGHTLCFPFTLDTYDQVLAAAQHTLYYNAQQGTIQMWASVEPNGLSISGTNSSQSYARLWAAGYTWNFYDLAQPQLGNISYTPPIDLAQGISRGVVYFLNVQNLENRDNNFYLKFTYVNG